MRVKVQRLVKHPHLRSDSPIIFDVIRDATPVLNSKLALLRFANLALAELNESLVPQVGLPEGTSFLRALGAGRLFGSACRMRRPAGRRKYLGRPGQHYKGLQILNCGPNAPVNDIWIT